MKNFPTKFLLVLATGFTLLQSCSKSDTASNSNNSNQTVTIGSQTWMLKNLDVDHYRNGDPIPQVTDPTAWAGLTTGAWCYYENNTANGTTYGKLYNWYAVNDPRGLAPIGWHVPNSNEWITLSTFVLGSEGALKSTILWESPNVGATNSSGFTALPGGDRYWEDGSFNFLGQIGHWWCSDEINSNQANSCYMSYEFEVFVRPDQNFGFPNKKLGFSVRCLKD